MNTSHEQQASEQAAQERIKASHQLDGDAVRLAHYYSGWANSYNLDVDRDRYCGPVVVAELAATMQAAYMDENRAAMAILDAGCGTGLVGRQLVRLGFQLIDGFDLSEAMAEKARQTGIYRQVQSKVDLNQPPLGFSGASYDMTVCCGVFTLGHVRPRGLRELVRVTRPNGFVIVSTRKSYAEATSFENEVLCLQNEGTVAPAQCLNDGKYLDEEDAHYWIFRVPKTPTPQQTRRS
ncbi:methyltransferase domain-containing protein [Mesorhizobium sp. VK25A]|uniref:Methyltransferase domain-containing protein n=1 Tax=Mesorhizobium vachelliae TaxID=3072309 RepID=A0ABU5AF22_9HYPH|nr:MULTISPECIES: methyltransferase domain-containing protein [unclassified Mesorhizobium]MDX8535858.1 methyltransferase domain-containing protein [Mesorhizobium sp. VK25D]MDX8548599.1 methyltransferase domain-containing protein [Mesorhizobium sp. VK25A]